MSITNLKQYDGRWSGVPYAGENIGYAGCGPTSVADLLGHSTPVEVANWMTKNGYASNGYGTYHSGIAAALKAYGYTAEQLPGSSLAGIMQCSQFDTFKQKIQAGYCGIILFGGTSTGCKSNYWTSGGHFVACVGYKDGKYLIHDPASASRDGYHVWESDISGNVKHLWTSSVKWSKGSDYVFGVKQIKLGDQGRDVVLMQRLLKIRGFKDDSGTALQIDGSFGKKSDQAVKGFQKKMNLKVDGICGPATWAALLDV